MNRDKWVGRSLVVVAVVVLGVCASVGAAPAGAVPQPWQFIALKPLEGGSPGGTLVLDVNNRGYSVGMSDPHPVLWNQAGDPEALPLPPGANRGMARAVNDWGLIVGNAWFPDPTIEMAVIWFGGVVVATVPDAIATAVNERGDVAGTIWPSKLDARPFVLSPGGSVVELPVVNRHGDTAAINDWGVVVGTEQNQPLQPFFMDGVGWLGTARAELFGGSPHHTRVSDVNNRGFVLATESRADGGGGFTHHPILRAPNGVVVELDPEHDYSDAVDINEHGVVTGYINGTNGDFDGVLWVYGAEIPLHTLLDADATTRMWLQTPTAVNDRLWVVGTRSGTESDRSWLLRPPGLPTTG